MVARGLVISGLLPTLGIHHHNRYNAYCLADDIMEPYRPYVDELVFSLIQEYGKNAELTKEMKTYCSDIGSDNWRQAQSVDGCGGANYCFTL